MHILIIICVLSLSLSLFLSLSLSLSLFLSLSLSLSPISLLPQDGWVLSSGNEAQSGRRLPCPLICIKFHSLLHILSRISSQCERLGKSTDPLSSQGWKELRHSNWKTEVWAARQLAPTKGDVENVLATVTSEDSTLESNLLTILFEHTFT